ncbi:MAG TPA: asparagine synthase (glutamine-hydrolyzing) [Candidatus Caccousia avistercoris]|nr:asparagine synthase (glutamine-hydrolyzing) [Candidatus Caccousia avistercoris]
MCGVCGFTGEILDRSDREQVLKRMTDVITHRGPDSSGFYCGGGVAMGFRRLSIIDVGEGGDQPIYNEDKTLVLTFNGEIYNYRQLREELVQKGHRFATHTDSEVLVHGFEEWGPQLLGRLRGMFGFAIWNTKDKSLFLARDYFGIKPMHYSLQGENFLYGSEIKSLLEFPGFRKEFNPRALDTYISFEYVAPPETFFQGVYCLPPAHYLWYRNGKVETHRYWEPKFQPDESMTEEQAVDAIEKVFEDSVAAHKISDVEVGCFLSSGVDSSYVSTFFQGQKTFTVGFDYGERYNEIDYAKDLSAKIGLEHHYKVITPEEYWGNIRKVQYHMDQPLADASCIALYFVSKIASEYVKVVLSGEGADELFGGYNIYHEPDDLAAYKRLPRFLRLAAAAVARALPFSFRGKSFLIRGSQDIEESFIGNCSMFTMEEKRSLLKEGLPCTRPQELTRPIYDRVKGMDDVTKMQYLDLNVWLVGDILLKADRMSMANSLELRVPFLDKEVFAVASRLPRRLRVNRENTKYAMRKAALRRLPPATAQKKKLGFPVPIRVWLREEKYYRLVKEAFESETAKRFFHTGALLRLLDDHYQGKRDNNRKIWTIYVFLVWYSIYFASPAEEPGAVPGRPGGEA